MPQEPKDELTQFIRCPLTKSDLKIASNDQVKSINEWIRQGKLLDQIGQVVEVEIESGYVNETGSLLFPIREGIVVLIADQAIPLNQLSAG